MAVIEGVGDEVLIVFAVFSAAVVVTLAWLSTHVSDYSPPIRILIFNRQLWLTITQRLRLRTTHANAGDATETTAQPPSADPPSDAPDDPQAQDEGSPLTSPSDSSAEDGGWEADWQRLRSEGHIRLRIKYLTERVRTVVVHPNITVGQLKSEHFREEQSNNLTVRIVHQGRELKSDASTLASLNITDDSCVHIVLSRRQPTSPPPMPTGQDSFNVGLLLVPLVACLLLAVWVLRFQYKQYFSVMATLLLIGITVLFVLIAYAGYQAPREHVD